MNKVLAVIVTYNRLEMLKKSIEHILMQDYPCDILITDNHSTDDTAAWAVQFAHLSAMPGEHRFRADVAAAFGSAVLYYEDTGANLGGAGGFNYGMRCACELGYDYAWIMDDDAFVNRTTLSELFEADKILGGPAHYGYLASTVIWTDGKECVMNRHRIHGRYYEDLDLLQYSIIAVEASTFVSLLLPTQTIKTVGLPIKEYFIWGDDVEYTMRIALRHNLKSYLVGKSIVTHAMKQNIGSDISVDSMDRMPNYKRAIRNENHTFRQYGFRGFFRYILRCGRFGLNVLTKSKDHRLYRLWIIVSRFFSGFFFNPEIEFPESKNS